MLMARKRNYLRSKSIIKTIQQAIPTFRTYESGMFEFQNNIFSATYKLKDVDFTSGSEEDQEDFFIAFSDILNSLDSRQTSYKITMFNRNINYMKTSFTELPTDLPDNYNHIRSEYNAMRRKNRAASNGIIQEKYITAVTVKKNNVLAEQYFDRFETDFGKRLKRIGSDVEQFAINDRMEIFYDFYRCGSETYYDYDNKAAEGRKSGYKDYICPDYLHFHNFDFDIGKKFGRVLFIKDWGKSLKVETLTQLMGLKTNMMISADIIPLSPEEQRRFLDDTESAAESNVDRYEKRPGAERKRYAVLPLFMRKDRDIINEVSEDINNRNQKIFLSNVSIVILANSYEELESHTESLIETGYECGCQVEVMGFQQRHGLNTVLPYGPRYTENLRDVTTENMAVMMPFNNISMNHPSGIPYGVQTETKQEMLIDRRLLVNGNEWVIAKSGGGKSFRVKLTAFMELLITNGDIIFVDPHGEFVALTQALGGEVIKIGGSSKQIINALDMVQGYGGKESDTIFDIRKKVELLKALFHAILGRDFSRQMESIVDRCSMELLKRYYNSEYSTVTPTLVDLYNEIKKQEVDIAQQLAVLIEPYVTGTLNCFSGQTNVNLNSRVICFDLSELGEAMWDAGMTVVMDTIRNRLISNFYLNKPTFIKIDEVGRYLDNNYLAKSFEDFYAEVRKYGGYITGIIQNANKLLKNERARNMVSNSEIVVMLRQSELDVAELKYTFGLSKTQVDNLLHAEEGCGLFKCGNQYINFDGRIEQGYIYDLINTKPKHDMY